MSDGSGNWVGKEVKMGWVLNMKEASGVYVSCVCQREITLESNGQDSPTDHPQLCRAVGLIGNRGVREGGWEAGKCRGKMVIRVLDVLQGL